MKRYMAYSREEGAPEGASLVFAHNIKEAKREAWPVISGYFADEFTDMAVTLIRDSEFLDSEADQTKLEHDEAHVVFAPTSCKHCNLWGYKLNEDGYCEDCEEGRHHSSRNTGEG